MIKRAIRHFWQRHTRGWDDSETWNLDCELQKWILPRLIRYKEIASRVIVIEDEYERALNEMIEGFAMDDPSSTEEGYAKQNRAYEQLAKWHGALWW